MEYLSLIRKKLKKSTHAAIAQITNRHAFDFKIEGQSCRYIHENGEGGAINVPEELHTEFTKLFRELSRFEKRIKSLNMETADVKRFICKYFRMKTEINKALQNVSVSVQLTDRP